jgi:hypothetical protein
MEPLAMRTIRVDGNDKPVQDWNALVLDLLAEMAWEPGMPLHSIEVGFAWDKSSRYDDDDITAWCATTNEDLATGECVYAEEGGHEPYDIGVAIMRMWIMRHWPKEWK